MDKETIKINQVGNDSTFKYSNETFSGCDMTASITMNTNVYNKDSGKWEIKPYTKILGELTTVSYSIHMEKKPIRSIGNVNAKDYVMGPRTIAGSLVFSVFNKHFAEDLIRNLNTGYTAGTAFLVDELPPFDLTISAANEYGFRSRMAIYGIRLLNEGQVMSINDVYTENTYQFFATDLEYLNSEMAYTRDKENKMYKLADRDIESFKYKDDRLKHKQIFWTQKQQDNYDKLMDRPISLLRNVKQPTRKDAPGIVTFTVDPPQDEGNVIIKNSNNEITTLPLKASSSGRSRKLSISLPPDSYYAYFENTRNKNVSNTVKFDVYEFYVKNKLSKYAPIIERVTDTEIHVYSNEPSHTKLKLEWKASSDSAENIYDIKNRRCILKGLIPDTTYTLYTFNETDKLPTQDVIVKTLTTKDKLFDELILFCYANSRKLIFHDMNIYNELIAEAKVIAINSNKNTTDSLLAVKNNYMIKIKALSDSLTDQELKNEYDLKIKACNELIAFSNKLYNDFIEAVNEKIDVPIPKVILNDKYENVFEFDSTITTAEFYKNYGNVVQFYYEVPKYNFKNIDGVENSFRFNGRPGHKHYVEALLGTVRSPKLEFYVLTQVEKDELIEKDDLTNNLTDKDIDKIDSQITKDNLALVETTDYKRAFMINAKKISNPILFPPEIETINDNILIRTSVNKIVDINYSNLYYLAIATYEDILCDNPIYKIQFTNKEEIIAVTKLLHGLKPDKEYSVWIEDENKIQLSNPSTLLYSKSFDLEEDDMKEYELKDISSKIKLIAESTLPREVYEDVLSIIENNNTVTNYNYINDILSVILRTTISKTVLVGFLKEFKYYIGIMDVSDGSYINNINYSNEICSFNSLSKGSLLMYNVMPGECISYTTLLEEVNSINTTVYQDVILLVAVDEKLKKKSNMILINKKEKYMEVL